MARAVHGLASPPYLVLIWLGEPGCGAGAAGISAASSSKARSGLDIKLDHGVDNMAMAMSLVASTGGVALMSAYARNLLAPSVVSRSLEGEGRRSK